jgi:SAM-dependent methyltransferase
MSASSCPLCHGTNEVLIGKNADSELMYCRDCGVRHVSPIPGPRELDARFNNYYGPKVEMVPQIFEHNRDNVLQVLAQVLMRRKGSGRILDIGCGSGYFLSRFFSSPGWQKWGSEICADTAALAEASGIRTSTGDFANAGFEDASFDAVCVLDTFYYFPDPLSTLQGIRRVLKPGGILLIEVPFAPTRLFRVSRKANRMDLFYYSPRPMVRLLKEARYQIESIIPLPANRQSGLIRNLLYSLYSFAARAVWSLSFHSWMTAPRFAVLASRELAFRGAA